ncbi:putative F-box/kelch-repeat protein [Raphanus sativus]|nr:putative F-box/kelch-repeat protein [Raphanus sativus]
MELEEAPQSKITTNPPPSQSFPSLPDEIIVTCLSLISRSYYPKLSLVSKRFRSLIFSNELYSARCDSKTREHVLHVCLKLPDNRLPSWYSMWIKPDQTLINELEEEENNNSTGRNTMLVEIPSSYSPRVPASYLGKVCSKYYKLEQDSISPKSSLLSVRNKGVLAPWGKLKGRWCEAPRMKVGRENAVAGALDGKIYVMGGCDAEESKNWAEVFDTNTQTWESLPDPGPELRSSLIKGVDVTRRRIYIESSEEKYHYYDSKEGRWGVSSKECKTWRRYCKIDHVRYICSKRGFFWYDKKLQSLRMVKGLEVLKKNCCVGVIAIANYGGKLLILWEKFEKHDPQNKEIWCSVIALKIRSGFVDDVLGIVEWASVVHTVPSSYVFLRCQVKSV